MTDPTPEYPQPPVQYVHVVPRRTDPLSVIALVLGILSVIGGWCCFGLPGFLALAAGIMGYRQTKDGSEAGAGMSIAGIVLGALTGIPWLFLGLFGVVGAFTK